MAERDKLPSLVRFEGFELDLRAGELRPEGGSSVRLSEQPFRILTALLERPGEVVLREEIRKTLWPNDTVVEFEHSINAAMKRLRQALGESAENPRYIETLARRGYRWTVPVQWVEPAPARPGSPRLPEERQPERESSTASMVGKRVSHYRVLEILGGGGMGVVYKAEDLKLGRRVAVKFLPEELASEPSALERFEREARAASALDHPNICSIYEFGEHEGQPFLVMQLLEGQTLRERIGAGAEQGAALGTGELLDLAAQITEGLDAAHQKGIIHRDIKPANIFVTTKGQAKILDFGVAKQVLLETARETHARRERIETGAPSKPQENAPATDYNPLLSRAGVAIGTAGYMSPEQARGEKLDARTDLFSLGLVVYEMATGQRAFPGETAEELCKAILNRTPTAVRGLNPQLPSKLEQIISKALEKNREARYQAASELFADLEALRGETAPRPQTSRWKEMAAGAVALLLMASAGFWFARRPAQSPAALSEIKLRQLTSNSSENNVKNGAISPDGKYLAYLDRGGMHLKRLETGETQAIPQPDELKGKWVDWVIGSWFPDGKRFLANAFPPGLDFAEETSQGSSIWIVPATGGPPQKLRDEAVAYSISRDGSTISFGTKKGRLGDREIWLMGAGGENARKLLDTDEDSSIGGLSWFPDGQRIFYGKLDEAGVNLVSRDLKGGPPVAILTRSEAKRLNEYLLLPDGRLIYALWESERHEDHSCNFWQARIDPRSGELFEKPRRMTDWAGFCMAATSVTSDSKEIAFLEFKGHSSVYVADLQAGGARLSNPTRLTLDDRWNNPFGWTTDGKTILFSSTRNGAAAIFKQSLGQDAAEPLPTTKQEAASRGGTSSQMSSVACLSPEGSWIFYMVSPEEGDPAATSKLMRIPITGGEPQLVMTANIEGAPHCARSPATLCAIAERSADRKQLVLTAFDPLKGRGSALAELKTDPEADYQWDLSSDGTRIAMLARQEGRIQIVSLNGQAPREITVKGWNSLTEAVWTADGKSLIVSSLNAAGSVLLGVDLQGSARILWENKGGFRSYAVPSPDGRRLAMRAWTVDGNMWIMENF